MRTLGLAALFLVAGCSAAEDSGSPIPFSTIFRTDQFFDAFEGSEPSLVVLQTSAEAEAFLAGFSERDRNIAFALTRLDYISHTVVAVLRGRRPNTSYSVDIFAIEGDDRGATVYAETGSAGGSRAEVWPVHFVLTPKYSGTLDLAPVRVVLDGVVSYE